MTENKKIKLTVEVDGDFARYSISKVIANRLATRDSYCWEQGKIDLNGEIFAAAVLDNGNVNFYTKDDFAQLPEVGDSRHFGKSDCRLFRLFNGELQEMKAIEKVVVEYVPIDSN
jgi:hypothetical protein